jgi:hypothetical protein
VSLCEPVALAPLEFTVSTNPGMVRRKNATF